MVKTGADRRPSSGRRVARRIAVATLAAAVAGGLAAGWVGVRGTNARDHLQRAAGLVQLLRQQVETGDAGAPPTLAALQAETRAARSNTGDPGWRFAGRTPVAGDDLAAVRTVAVALDELAHNGLPPLVEVAGQLTAAALAPKHGRIDLRPLQAAAPRIAAADAAVRLARSQVATIPLDGVVPRLREAVVELRQGLDRAAAITATAARSAALLPPLLGAHGRRTYLVLFQNLAEVRATGGMPGAYVVIGADRGAVRIVDQGSASALRTFARPVLPLDGNLRALYSDRLGKFPADVNFTPHFPTAARLAREMYRRRSGRTVDGVLATDPVALSYVLRTIGPVAVPGGTTLTAGNAVRVLLSEAYAGALGPVEQDNYFSAAAKATFGALMRRPVDPAAVLAQLAKAAGERRLLLWSAVPAEQAVVTGTVLDGTLPETDGATPTVGVFLNDGTGAKLSYYLRHSAELTVAGCRPDGRLDLRLRVTLRSTAPRSGLSPAVLGIALAGEPYTIRTNVLLVSPTGGGVVRVRMGGRPVAIGAGEEQRRAVGVVTVDLRPGATRTLEATLVSGIPPTGWGPTVTPRLRTTPGIGPARLSVRSADGCRIAR
jgi:hypothetical protein